MNVEEIKYDVIHSETPTRLFEIMIELTEAISQAHLDLVKTDDNIIKTEIRGRISLFTTLQNIVDKRLEDVKSSFTENERRELFTNRQFRIAAETVLQKETFERIKDLSVMNYKKFKDAKTDLKANKLE